MSFWFQRRIIFRVQEALPDPEEQKWRFRRRVVFWTFILAVIALAVPVIKDSLPLFRTMGQTRLLGEQILESRLLATQNRCAVSLSLNPQDKQTWIRRFHTTDSCNSPFDSTPEQVLRFHATLWRLERVANASTKQPAQSIFEICFNPKTGISVDGTPLGTGRLVAQGFPKEDVITQRTDRVAQVFIDNGTGEVQILP